jgi:hypothetical protein
VQIFSFHFACVSVQKIYFFGISIVKSECEIHEKIVIKKIRFTEFSRDHENSSQVKLKNKWEKWRPLKKWESKSESRQTAKCTFP